MRKKIRRKHKKVLCKRTHNRGSKKSWLTKYGIYETWKTSIEVQSKGAMGAW